jgi:hypothetical protein
MMEDLVTQRFQKIALFCSLLAIVTGVLYWCGDQDAASDVDAHSWAEQVLSGISLEEKIGQLICVDITADYIAEDDLRFLKKLFRAKPESIVAMSYGNPFLIRKIGEVPAFLVGFGEKRWYGNQAVYFDSFIMLLKGDLLPQGKLPIKVSDRYPLGHGLSY